MARTKSSKHGFTLIEILIVVVILGVLASIVIPQFTSATDSSRENTLKMDLHRIRTQLILYQQQHNGNYPTVADFVTQMTQASNTAGDTAAPGTAGYPHGPYIQQMPLNPWTSTRDVGTGAAGSSAWYFNPTTGDFRANDSAQSRTY